MQKFIDMGCSFKFALHRRRQHLGYHSWPQYRSQSAVAEGSLEGDRVTGLSDDQLWVSVTEIPPSNAMEFGAIIAEVGHEAEWLAS
jgi:hypothetical protein